MKLSEEQIQHLYEFTRQHYVEYYDLQTELVDHLANAIEEQWQENPKLSFESALDIEFRKFGIFGFMDVVEKRQFALGKKYRQIVLKHLKTFFKLPQVLGTFSAIGIMIYILRQLQDIEYIITIIMTGLIILLYMGLFILSFKKKKKYKQTGKKWLFNEIIFGYRSVLGLNYITFQFTLYFSQNLHNQWILLFWSVFTVVLLLISYIILFLIPSKAQEYLKQTHPEYEMAE